MRRVTYERLAHPPSRVGTSELASVERSISEAPSTYVFADNKAGKELSWKLVEAIIELESEKSTRLGLSSYGPDYRDGAYRSGVRARLMEAFESRGKFHMQVDLKTMPDSLSTNLPNSEFREMGNVIAFDMRYFNPSGVPDVQRGIEAKLGLEKEVVAAVQRLRYTRVGKGLYFKVPFSKRLSNISLLMPEIGVADGRALWKNASEEAERALRLGHAYKSDFGGMADGNKYTFSVGLPNIDRRWLEHVRVVGGAFLGPAVAREVYLLQSQRSRRADFEQAREQGIRRIEQVLKKGPDYSRQTQLEKKLARLKDKTKEEEDFREFRDHGKMALQDHRKNLRDADKKFGTENKVAMPWKGTTEYLYLADPILQRAVSLGDIVDYPAAKKFIASYFPDPDRQG